MIYKQIEWVPEDQDPSLTLETSSLVAKVIDNTGLQLQQDVTTRFLPNRYGLHKPMPYSHIIGGNGIRTLYNREEKRNAVGAAGCWLNLQNVNLPGVELDPVDERVNSTGRGWPMRIEKKGQGVALTMDELPESRLSYRIEYQPAEPDGIEFSVRFTFGKAPTRGPRRFSATWPCYQSVSDDIRFHYPEGTYPDNWEWSGIGEKQDMILGETVGYVHRQQSFWAEEQAIPLGYGRTGQMVLALMFDDPRITFFVVNAGGHLFYSPVHNPAWDFRWEIEDYPLDESIGFNGKLIYAPFVGQEVVMERYRDWIQERSGTPTG